MNLHESPAACLELIHATAEHFKIPSFYVEKDYWVTRSLKYLHESDVIDSFVLKGGTSLSKAHRIIERFSEDIDLALRCESNLTDGQRKRLIKRIVRIAAQGLQYQEDHAKESKGSSFRRTAQAFPKVTDSTEFGQVSDVILIEINAFANPKPSAMMPIATLVYDFLSAAGREDLISEYQLEPFGILVLGVERTLCEKIMGLVRASYEKDPLAAQRSRVRHFYDVALIMRDQKFKDFVASREFLELVDEVRDTDRKVMPNAEAWTDRPLCEAAVFSDPSAVWSRISRTYHGSFKEMVFGESIPSGDEVLTSLGRIRDALDC